MSQWGNVYKTLINGRHDGYVVNGGRCPPVGVGSFILGGGNFGVLVGMKLKAQRLRSNDVVAGQYTWFPAAGMTDGFLATMNGFYAAEWPDGMTIDSNWLCSPRQNGRNGVRFTMYYDGNKKEFDEIIDKNIDDPGLATQFKRRALPEKSTRFLHETLVAQWSEEIKRSFPTNKSYEIYSSFVFNNNSRKAFREITAIIREAMTSFREDFGDDNVQLRATWIHSGGKATEKDPTETAFFWRQGFKKKLRPFSLEKKAAFINFPDGRLRTATHEAAYFGKNRDELRRVKQMWDKDNFFRWEQGVQLPQAADDDASDVDESDEERFTDRVAGEQWQYYQTNDLMEDLKELADLGL